MAGSHNKRVSRAAMILMSFAIVLIAALAFLRLTHLTNSLQAQTLPVLQLDVGTLTEPETVGTVTLNVTVNPAPSELITVSFTTVNNTATAGSNSDYLQASGIITFASGENRKPITIIIRDDSAQEPLESFLLQLSNPVSATLGSPSVASINITDNDNITPSPCDSGSQVFADQYEPNNNLNEATETAAGATPLCRLTFYPPGDQDYFRWWGKAGITYIVKTSNLYAGLDTVIDVYNPNQSLIGTNDDVSSGIFSSEFRFTAGSEGYYYARVTNKTPIDPVDKRYYFEVDQTVEPTTTPPPGFPPAADDCEFNSTIETACLFVAGETKASLNFVPSLGSPQDTDIFKMWVKPGIYYTCETVIPAGSAADTNIILWDSNGNPFNPWIGNDDKIPGGLDFGSKVNYLANYTGWLFIVVGPVNVPPLDEAPQHQYSLTCLALESTPTPTPSPTTAFTGGGGTGGTFATATPQPTVAFPTPFPTPTPIDFSAFTPEPPPIVQFQPLPTSTPSSGGTQSANINVTLYYDTNNNFLPELTEGIVNAAVSLYDNGTGELISFGHTNEVGEVRFTGVNAAGAVRVVVPFLNYSQVVLGSNADILVRVAPQPLPIGIP